MIEKNMPPQFQDDPKQPNQKTNLERNEDPGHSPATLPGEESERNDESRQGQENKERSGKKSAGSGEETLGIP